VNSILSAHSLLLHHTYTHGCLAVIALPHNAGGARCTVLDNSCSTMPAKAYPPPSPNIFWQITSRDDQGWDFCADPTYDAERAAQPNDTAVALAALPVNVRGGVSLTTQAGCTCSPLNWTYYPAVVQDGEGPAVPVVLLPPVGVATAAAFSSLHGNAVIVGVLLLLCCRL
jgi:hypothetical protein